MISNCFMMEAPSGIFGIGKSSEVLLATQTLLLESNASVRTAIPPPEGFLLEGRQPGSGRPCLDCELLTQTRSAGR